MSIELALALALIIPTVGAVLIAVTGKNPNLRESMTLATAVLLFLDILWLLSRFTAGETLALHIHEIMPGLSLALRVDPLGMLFATIASGLWIVNSVYSIGYMRGTQEKYQTRFYVCFAIAILGAMGIAFSANMFTLFIFYEILTLSTYPLVIHKETPEAKRAGRVYLGLLLGTSIGFQMVAIIWTWVATGTLDFTDGGILAGHIEPVLLPLLLALYMFGIGKAALMPFQRWLPAAMVAPTPVSALLHAVAVVKAGVFTVTKVITYIFGLDLLTETGANDWLVVWASICVLVASLIAMTKDNLKARLAYSTVSQLGYVVVGAALATSMGVIGSGMHMAMHAAGKITLFFCAGAIYVATHKTEISQMDGIGRRMPITMFAFFLGALCVIGVPPTGGIWSKWHFVVGAYEAGYGFVVATLMISTLLNVAYLLPPVVRAFLKPLPEGEPTGIQEAPMTCVIPLSITALLTVALFFYSGPIAALLGGIFAG